jgi:hypothetical protein
VNQSLAQLAGPCPGCGASLVVAQVQWHLHQLYGTVLFQCSRCAHGEYQQVSKQLLAQFKQPGLWTPEPEPEKPPAPDPLRVIEGSVIGYRAWRIKDWALTGTGVNRAWLPGVNEATCDPGRDKSQFGGLTMYSLGGYQSGYTKHPAPAVGCHCGITALARFADQDEHWDADDVPGAIEAWSDETADGYGRFILHGTGFRAQYGKVVLLAVDDAWPAAKKGAVRALAAKHGADVCKRSHLEDAAKEHGQLVPDEMLEWAKEGDPEPNHLPSILPSGGYVTQPTQWMPQYISRGNAQIYTWSSSIPYPPPSRPKPTRKGICQTLGYPGPPADPTTKRSKGARVRDSKGQIWQCVKGGKPGMWEAEER